MTSSQLNTQFFTGTRSTAALSERCVSQGVSRVRRSNRSAFDRLRENPGKVDATRVSRGGRRTFDVHGLREDPVRAEVRLQRVGVPEVLSAQHALVRERVVVDATVPLVVAVVGKRRVAVGAAVRALAGVNALV